LLTSYPIIQYSDLVALEPGHQIAQEMPKDMECSGRAEKDANSEEIKEKCSQHNSQLIWKTINPALKMYCKFIHATFFSMQLKKTS
jgi:hypothetical protein